MQPTVSVVIPTYNRLPHLRDAVASILAQTRPVDEIIIVDDGSSDGTEAAWSNAQAPVRYVRQKNGGPSAARNRGFREAKGTWIALLDSDDVWLPDKMAAQLAFLERHPHLDFLFGHMVLWSPQGVAEKPEILDADAVAYCERHAADLADFLDCLLRANLVPTSSVVFRRSCLDRVGFMREDLHCAEDYEWWTRWAMRTRCGFLDQVVERRRIHDSNIISDRRLMLETTLQVLDYLDQQRGSLTPTQAATLDRAIHRQRYRVGSELYRTGDYKRAAELLGKIRPSKLAVDLWAKWLGKAVIARARA